MSAQLVFDALPSVPPAILGPEALLDAMDALSLPTQVIGHSRAGVALRAWRFGSGRRAVLLYGFPDPGEAVGGTVILALAQAWLRGALDAFDVTWHCLPVANPDDQPADLRAPVRKVAAEEIDWWTHAPRPEATALLEWATQVQPDLILPLHDEFHDRIPRPAYFPVSRVVPTAFCGAVRQWFEQMGHAVDAGLHHAEMGAGFGLMTDLAGDDWQRCTFRHLDAHGPVVIPEVAAGLPDATLLWAQLGVVLLAVDHLLAPSP
jgi:hypothetical protein